MKKETLNSLLIDRELGELMPEMVELLEAYLVAVPTAQVEAKAMAQTVATARTAVRGLPVPISMETRFVPSRWFATWPSVLARAAVLLALLGVSAWLGFRSGVVRQAARQAPTTLVVASAPMPKAHEFQRQWARYQLAYDEKQKGFVVQNMP